MGLCSSSSSSGKFSNVDDLKYAPPIIYFSSPFRLFDKNSLIGIVEWNSDHCIMTETEVVETDDGSKHMELLIRETKALNEIEDDGSNNKAIIKGKNEVKVKLNLEYSESKTHSKNITVCGRDIDCECRIYDDNVHVWVSEHCELPLKMTRNNRTIILDDFKSMNIEVLGKEYPVYRYTDTLHTGLLLYLSPSMPGWYIGRMPRTISIERNTATVTREWWKARAKETYVNVHSASIQALKALRVELNLLCGGALINIQNNV